MKLNVTVKEENGTIRLVKMDKTDPRLGKLMKKLKLVKEAGTTVGFRYKRVCPECVKEGVSRPKQNYCKRHKWTYSKWDEERKKGMAEVYGLK